MCISPQPQQMLTRLPSPLGGNSCKHKIMQLQSDAAVSTAPGLPKAPCGSVCANTQVSPAGRVQEEEWDPGQSGFGPTLTSTAASKSKERSTPGEGVRICLLRAELWALGAGFCGSSGARCILGGWWVAWEASVYLGNTHGPLKEKEKGREERRGEREGDRKS